MPLWKVRQKAMRYDRGRGSRSWRACDWNTHKVYIVADVPRVICPEHGVVTASVPWARHNSHFTKEFEELATWLSLSSKKTMVSSLLRISWNIIGSIISRMRSELDPDPVARFEGLVRIGVDETSYKKGHKYITVVINHDTGKVIWAHEGHGKTVFSQFFKLLSREQLAKIQLVSGDGAKWIQACIDDYCPGAKRCIDPFHIVQWATEALDGVRREAWRDARKDAKNMPRKKRGCPKKEAPKDDASAKDLKGSRIGRMDQMGSALPHPGIRRTSEKDTPSLRCNPGNDGTPSLQCCTESNKSKNQVVCLYGLWLPEYRQHDRYDHAPML